MSNGRYEFKRQKEANLTARFRNFYDKKFARGDFREPASVSDGAEHFHLLRAQARELQRKIETRPVTDFPDKESYSQWRKRANVARMHKIAEAKFLERWFIVRGMEGEYGKGVFDITGPARK
ncbi:MAG: hypothetical protein RLZZ283_754 [Candidatus Parcubacteria bacterium]